MGAEAEDEGKEQYMSFAMAAIQRATIQKLRKDNDALKEELYLENKFSVTPIDNIAVRRIAGMQDEADALTRKIQLEQRRVKLAEFEAKQLTQELAEDMEVIKHSGGINSATDKAIALQKEIKRNESRRQQASIKYNEAFTHCKKLRAQIDSLRRERLVFDGIHSKLTQELKERKNEMAKIIAGTNKAFEQREKCLSEMAQLKLQADKEQADFEKEWKHLGSIIDDDKRKRELMRQREMEERQRKTQELLKSKEDALTVKASTNKSKEPKAKRYKTDEVESMDKVQMLGEAFQKIQIATGIQEIDELIEKFKSADDQNYTLFTYVNELNQEIALLEEQVKKIQTEIEDAQRQDVVRENERLKVQQELEERLHSNEEMADVYQKRFENASRTVNDLKNSVQSLFQKFGCSTPAVRELLGDGGVTDQNILQYLAVIEQRVNEILRVYISSMLRSGQDAEHLKVPLGQAAPVPDQTEVKIMPPSTNDEEYEDMENFDEDADPKPLGQEQLMTKVRSTLPRKLDEKAVYRISPEEVKKLRAGTGKGK